MSFDFFCFFFSIPAASLSEPFTSASFALASAVIAFARTRVAGALNRARDVLSCYRATQTNQPRKRKHAPAERWIALLRIRQSSYPPDLRAACSLSSECLPWYRLPYVQAKLARRRYLLQRQPVPDMHEFEDTENNRETDKIANSMANWMDTSSLQTDLEETVGDADCQFLTAGRFRAPLDFSTSRAKRAKPKD